MIYIYIFDILVGGLEHNWTMFSMYWEFHHPNWRTHIFQRGRHTTNQQVYTYILEINSKSAVLRLQLLVLKLVSFDSSAVGQPVQVYASCPVFCGFSIVCSDWSEIVSIAEKNAWRRAVGVWTRPSVIPSLERQNCTTVHLKSSLKSNPWFCPFLLNTEVKLNRKTVWKLWSSSPSLEDETIGWPRRLRPYCSSWRCLCGLAGINLWPANLFLA